MFTKKKTEEVKTASSVEYQLPKMVHPEWTKEKEHEYKVQWIKENIVDKYPLYNKEAECAKCGFDRCTTDYIDKGVFSWRDIPDSQFRTEQLDFYYSIEPKFRNMVPPPQEIQEMQKLLGIIINPWYPLSNNVYYKEFSYLTRSCPNCKFSWRERTLDSV